jgi:hypothetical protein
MRVLLPVFLLTAFSACAEPASPSGPPPSRMSMASSQDGIDCLDVNGRSKAPVCRRGSVMAPMSDICQCSGVADRVIAPICGPGESPPVESAELMVARHKAAEDGSLIGDTFHGKPMCVLPPSTRRTQ